MSDSLFPGYEEYAEEKAAESQHSYELRMLKKLYAAVGELDQHKLDAKEADDEFGFAWFNDTHPLPIKLYASKVKDVSPAQLLRSEGMTRTPLWKAYFECKANHPARATVGMFFSVPKMSQFIIHNWPALGGAVGANRIVRAATNPDNALVIEPSGAFFKSLVRWGWWLVQ